MTNPYETLGVSRDATLKDIQSAYRKLAKKLHPDLNPGDKGAEDRFKTISAAYALLSDEEKRGKYDRGEIDETGAETASRHYYRDYAGSGDTAGRYESAHGFSDFADADDIFSSFFSRRSGRPRRQRGRDQHFSMEISFLDAANGTKTEISLPGGGPALDLTIPNPVILQGQVRHAGTTISGARIRAWIIPTASSEAAMTPAPTVIQIGETTSGENGLYRLLLPASIAASISQ